MRALVFDLEIIRSPHDNPDGWEAARRGECGVSCVAVHDNLPKRCFLYNEYDLEECVNHLNDADILVSFNGIEFDVPCLQGATNLTIASDQYDILHEVWRALGQRKKGYRLNEICQRLELGEKTGDGERATDMYRDGEFTKLYGYCRNDVELTRRLCNFISNNGYILTPEGEPLELSNLEVEV